MVDIQVVFDTGSSSDGQQFGLAAQQLIYWIRAGNGMPMKLPSAESVDAQFGVSSSIDWLLYRYAH
jgi:hypothetical protein